MPETSPLPARLVAFLDKRLRSLRPTRALTPCSPAARWCMAASTNSRTLTSSSSWRRTPTGEHVGEPRLLICLYGPDRFFRAGRPREDAVAVNWHDNAWASRCAEVREGSDYAGDPEMTNRVWT
jgi:hypothetical protein